MIVSKENQDQWLQLNVRLQPTSLNLISYMLLGKLPFNLDPMPV